MTKPDMVNKPPHYLMGKVECIEAIQSALGDNAFIAYCRGQAIKYTWRSLHKWYAAEDLQKAVWYLNRAIATLETINEAHPSQAKNRPSGKEKAKG